MSESLDGSLSSLAHTSNLIKFLEDNAGVRGKNVVERARNMAPVDVPLILPEGASLYEIVHCKSILGFSLAVVLNCICHLAVSGRTWLDVTQPSEHLEDMKDEAQVTFRSTFKEKCATLGLSSVFRTDESEEHMCALFWEGLGMLPPLPADWRDQVPE